MNAKASPILITEPARPPHPFWSGAFRPLFLLAGILAIVGVVWWVAGMAHGLPTPTMGSGAWWHGHEMIFGFGGAAIGGFLLTAIANWTGRPPIAGRLLMVLTATWLIARLAAGFADHLPLVLILIGGLGYFITLMAIAGRELIQGRNHRNLVILGLIGLITLMDGLFIVSTLGAITLDPMVIYQTAILVIVLLIGLIGGRIIPAFTRNWMQRDGMMHLPMPVMFNKFDGVCLAVLTIAIALNLFDPTRQIAGIALLLAGVLHVIRMARWRGIYTWRDPLVAILHLAYLWVPVGLIVLGIAMLAPDVMAARDALHGLTGGAMACMILAIGGRAALGHTGRDLRASPALLIAFGAIWIGTVLRLLVGISTDYYMVILAAATLLWIGGWIAFLIGYAPVLWGPARQKSRGIPVR